MLELVVSSLNTGPDTTQYCIVGSKFVVTWHGLTGVVTDIDVDRHEGAKVVTVAVTGMVVVTVIATGLGIRTGDAMGGPELVSESSRRADIRTTGNADTLAGTDMVFATIAA